MLLVCGVAVGCRNRSEEVTSERARDLQEERRLGVLPDLREHGTPSLELPDTVEAGLAFNATVRTVVGGCTRGGEVEVQMQGDDVLLVAYDYVRTGPGPTTGGAIACPLYLAFHARRIPLRFDRPGVVRVRLRGADGTERGETTTVEGRVVVVRNGGYRCDPPSMTEGCR